MYPEFKKPWIEALRSGKYEQGFKYLNRDGKYCCLGVLCDLLAKDNLISVYPLQDTHQTIEYEGDTGGLSIEVQLIVGLQDDIGNIRLTPKAKKALIPYYDQLTRNSCALDEHPKNWVFASLAVLNDKKIPFSVIADLIEECL